MVTRIQPDNVAFTATDELLGRATAGAGAGEEVALTAAGRALIDDADATAQRATLALGTMATQNANAVAITGGTITGMPTPSGSTDVANKAYVDGLVNGIKWKQSVRCSSTANGLLVTAFANGTTHDGVTILTGDYILIQFQTAGEKNGIYLVAPSGAPLRRADADSAIELESACVLVEEGTLYGNKAFIQTADNITLETTPLVWANLGTALGSVSSVTGTAPIASTGGTTPVISLNDDGITDAKLRNSGGLSVIGRSANTSGDPADITAGSDGDVLRRAGTVLGFGQIVTAGITDANVTYAKIQNVSATDKVLGRSTAGAGVVEEIACTATGRSIIDDTSITAVRTTIGVGSFADEETPTGTIDGSNAAFTIANTPLTGSLKLYKNGIRMTGGGVDYTLSGTTITYVAAAKPKTSGSHVCDYRY